MTEEVKPDVIKKTQDSLKKHIKKPPLTEKLLKKPPFRFLHDIVTSVIRDTGFLDGLFSPEELNHENIKDRDGKIAFLDKLISAVKIITSIPLSVRATKIVAGHEPTKTNELLQAIGLALDKKLDSRDVSQQLRKRGAKKSDAPDSKKSSPREQKEDKSDGSKSKSQERPTKKTDEASDKKKSSSSSSKQAKESSSQDEPTEKKKRSSTTQRQTKVKDQSKTSKPKKEAATSEPKMTDSKEPVKEEATAKAKAETSPVHLEPAKPDAHFAETEQKRPPSAKAQRRSSAAKHQAELKQPSFEEQPPASSMEKKTSDSLGSPQKAETSASILPPLSSEPTPNTTEPTESRPTQAVKASNRTPSAAPAQAQAPAPVPLARPRTAARVGSARPGAPRVRNKGEALVVSEELTKPTPVNLIVEDESSKVSNDDEDENLVVVESAPVDEVSENYQPSAPTLSRPSSQQGHLVAQILETQKELEVGKSTLENGENLQYHTEIEWEAGKKRERETAMKEVDQMRSLIQSLTRAAHPLGKLMDSLQEDVDNMQRELSQWQSMQSSLEQQLQTEETLSMKASQPLEEQLKQLQQAIHSQLDQISAAKANIFNNDDRIRRLLCGGQS